jgi:hypothetical protein
MKKEISITIPDDAWEPSGPELDPEYPEGLGPETRLLAGITINGVPMHLEAYQVTNEDGQRAADITFADDIEHLQSMQDVSGFQTTTIRGREYVLVATPHED